MPKTARHFIFQAVRGGATEADDKGDISIDNIKLELEKCLDGTESNISIFTHLKAAYQVLYHYFCLFFLKQVYLVRLQARKRCPLSHSSATLGCEPRRACRAASNWTTPTTSTGLCMTMELPLTALDRQPNYLEAKKSSLKFIQSFTLCSLCFFICLFCFRGVLLLGSDRTGTRQTYASNIAQAARGEHGNREMPRIQRQLERRSQRCIRCSGRKQKSDLRGSTS